MPTLLISGLLPGGSPGAEAASPRAAAPRPGALLWGAGQRIAAPDRAAGGQTMKKMPYGGAPDAIRHNRPDSAWPEAVRDLAELLAEIAAQQLRNEQSTKDEGGRE